MVPGQTGQRAFLLYTPHMAILQDILDMPSFFQRSGWVTEGKLKTMYRLLMEKVI